MYNSTEAQPTPWDRATGSSVLVGASRRHVERGPAQVPVQVGVADDIVESEGPSRAAGGGLVDRLPVRGAFVAFLCVCTSVPALSWDNIDWSLIVLVPDFPTYSRRADRHLPPIRRRAGGARAWAA